MLSNFMIRVNTMHWKGPHKMVLILIAYLTIIATHHASSSTLYVTEGEKKRLTFPFPCSSTEVTLRHGYKAPFYNSANQGRNLLSSPRFVITNQNDSGSDECFLHLTIHNVTRGDEGTYILTAYKNGAMLPDYPRIGLRVEYPPGKVSCEPSSYCRGWIRLQCTAQAGRSRSTGEIVCFQSGCRMPPLTTPKIHDAILSQTILAKKSDVDPVHCCSSRADHVKEICECKDWGWCPTRNTSIFNITDPCPDVVSIEDLAPSTKHLENNASTPNLQKLPPVPSHVYQENPVVSVENENLTDDALFDYIYVIICLLILLIVLVIFLICALLYCLVPAVKEKTNKLFKKISCTWSEADSGLKTKQQGERAVTGEENP